MIIQPKMSLKVVSTLDTFKFIVQMHSSHMIIQPNFFNVLSTLDTIEFNVEAWILVI